MKTFSQLREALDDHHDYFHVTHASNVKSIMKHGLKPSIGPRSKKLGETKKATYLFHSKGDAEDAMSNWLGDEMGDRKASLLKVKVPKSKVHSDEDGFEHRVHHTVHPKHISVEEKDF